MRYGLCFILACLLVSQFRIEAQHSEPPGKAEEGASSGPEERTILGAPPAFDLSGDRGETIRIEAEARLHRQPAQRSPTLTQIAAVTELPVLERRPPWVRVRYGSWQGWVLVDDEVPDDDLLDLPDEPWWTPRQGPDHERLELARSFLASEQSAMLGPYRLYTDITRTELLEQLSHLVGQLPAIFEQRFGLTAAFGENDTVVLFAREESYRAFAEAQGDPAAVDSLGHAIGGLAVLTAGERKPDEVRSLLVHELTHVLTYHALGPDLPAWLVEGLADELAYSRVTSAGEITVGTLDGWRSTASQPVRRPDGGMQFLITTKRGGPEAALENLRQRWRESAVPPLDVLLGMPRLDFMDSERRQLHYSMSAFLVRYLLASDRDAARFRVFLRAVANGDNGDGEDLLEHLATTWSDLESGFADWLYSAAPAGGAKSKKKR